MSHPPPNAKPPPAAQRVLHVALWGIDVQPTADALLQHCRAQEGWSERLRLCVHEYGDTLASADCRTWLQAELLQSGKPHLSLLVTTPAAESQAKELLLRDALAHAGIGFQVLYGNTLAERIINAANAIALTSKTILHSSDNACFALKDVARPAHPRMQSWSCEKCSDPECEHRLFSALVAG